MANTHGMQLRVLPLLLILLALPVLAQDAYVKRATARETYFASLQARNEGPQFGPWHYVGPFDSTNGSGFEKKYPPEEKIDLNATYPGKGGKTMRWQRGRAFLDGETNSLSLFDDNESIAVYLYRTITVPSARELPVLLGSDDTLTVWLNGEQLLAKNVGRAAILGDDRLTLNLKQGENHLLLKVCQGGGPCGFAFGVDTGADTLLNRVARDFPGGINDLLLELDWLRQATAQKLPPGVSIAPEDDAPGACDGVKNGGTGFHTQLEDKPWWQVDLGQVYPLERALLYNREDAAERIAQVIMLLSDDGQQWRQVWQNDGTVFHGGTDGKPGQVPLEGQAARYVRLQQPGREFLHLDEVEILSAGKNVALDRPCTQSSSSPWSTYTPLTVRNAAGVATDPHKFKPAAAETLDLARRTLGFVQQSRPLPELAQQLQQLETKIAAAPADSDWQDLYVRLRRLRRQMILSHPLLDFDRLLVVKRGPPLYSHMVDQYEGRHSQPGDGLVMLTNWKTAPRAEALLAGKLPLGAVGHPELSFDATRVVFNFCDHTVTPADKRQFFLHELDLASGKVRQLTGVPGVDPLEGWEGRETVAIEDFDPCYLPDGGVAFVSTRNQAFGRCHGGRYTPAYVLYRCDADGSNITRLSYGEANEWNPGVLPDGRIIYTRWDYINRHDTLFQSLWVTRPDGSATGHYYSNSTRNPCMVAQSRAIPGTDLVAGLAMAHHSYSAGSILTVDRRRGEEGLEPVTRITPECSFPETEGWSIGSYADPFPLSPELYLAAYDPNGLISQGKVARPDGYGIYLVDTLGGRELLYRDPATCCFAPIPVQPRSVPPVIPSALARDETDGVFIIQNVYRSMVPLEPGSVKSLRVVAMHEQPAASAAERSIVSQEIVKSVVGTVPVAADGSVAFRAPACEPLLFQLLDQNNVSLFSMRSQVYLQPGETMSCTGCHEPRGTTPSPVTYLKPAKPQPLQPPTHPQYPGGFSFARTVQPVLDRYCIGCHGLKGQAGSMSLLGTPTRDFSESYDGLVNRPGMVKLAFRNVQTDDSKPGDYGARAGKLADHLLTKHADKVKLDRDSFTRLAEWLDLNCQYYGDYSFTRHERRQPSEPGVKALRAHLSQSCNSCHTGRSDQPLAALVNMAAPDESRVLMVPLGKASGGWEQCKELWQDTAAAGYATMRELVLKATGE